MSYNHPNYLVLREALKEPHVGAITAAAATGGLVGSTFRSYAKAVVFGVAGITSTAGSGGGCKVVVARVQGVGGTVSLCPYTMVDTSLAANITTFINFSSPLTLTSMGDCVLLHGSASAANDVTEFGAVIWRYRLLPDTGNNLSNTQAG